MVLHTAGAFAEEDHIVQLVLNITDIMLPGKLHQIIRDHFGIAGTVGHAAEFFKITKYRGRLQAGQFLCFHVNSLLILGMEPFYHRNMKKSTAPGNYF